MHHQAHLRRGRGDARGRNQDFHLYSPAAGVLMDRARGGERLPGTQPAPPGTSPLRQGGRRHSGRPKP